MGYLTADGALAALKKADQKQVAKVLATGDAGYITSTLCILHRAALTGKTRDACAALIELRGDWRMVTIEDGAYVYSH